MTADSPASGSLPPEWSSEVLRFWFVETPRDAWFRKDAAFDQTCRARFGTWIEPVARLGAPTDARTALATTIVLDQFPRNLFRGSPRAFAHDTLARAVVNAAMAAGFDQALDKDGRLFLYLPLEHSEDLADQERSVMLITQLGNDEYTRFAVAHRDIIARFGRFPHRNAVLGRASTPQELAFLAGPMSSF